MGTIRAASERMDAAPEAEMNGWMELSGDGIWTVSGREDE